MTNPFYTNLEWSRRYDAGAIELMYVILGRHLRTIINIDISPLEIDQEKGIDLLFRSNSGDIALRMRRPGCRFRDLTIQTQQVSGRRDNTEYVKIFEEGHVRWYLYCWIEQDHIKDWMFVDLDEVRRIGLIDRYPREIPNPDGQLFRGISYKVLLQNNCIVEHYINH